VSSPTAENVAQLAFASCDLFTLLRAMDSTEDTISPDEKFGASIGYRLLVWLLYDKGLPGSVSAADAMKIEDPKERLQKLLKQWGDRQSVSCDSQGVPVNPAVLLLFLDDAQMAPKAVAGILRAARDWNFGSGLDQSAPNGYVILPIVLCTVSPLLKKVDSELLGATGWFPWQQSITIRLLDQPRWVQCVENIASDLQIQLAESSFLLGVAQETNGWPVALQYMEEAIKQLGLSGSPSTPKRLSLNDCQLIYHRMVLRIEERYIQDAKSEHADSVKNLLRLALTGHAVLVRKHSTHIMCLVVTCNRWSLSQDIYPLLVSASAFCFCSNVNSGQ
jgi:hypothetical protein